MLPRSWGGDPQASSAAKPRREDRPDPHPQHRRSGPHTADRQTPRELASTEARAQGWTRMPRRAAGLGQVGVLLVSLRRRLWCERGLLVCRSRAAPPIGASRRNTVTGQFAPPASVGPIARRSRVRHQHPFPFIAAGQPPNLRQDRSSAKKTLGTSWQRCDIRPKWLIVSFFFGIGIKPKRELDRK